ncbi:MAG: hypothetical protein ACW9XA_08015 [Candidatus Nitrosopumilus sp. bin_6a]
MSYIENRRSIEDYLDSIKERSKKNHIGSILNQFNIFCKQNFNKTHQEVIDDIKEEITKTNSNDKIYVLFNKYKDWLGQDHPEITYYTGKYSKHQNTIKKRHPNSIKQYISKMRNIFEEVGNIEINNRVFNKRVMVESYCVGSANASFTTNNSNPLKEIPPRINKRKTDEIIIDFLICPKTILLESFYSSGNLLNMNLFFET